MGEIKAGLASVDVLLIHLVDEWRRSRSRFARFDMSKEEHARGVRTDYAKREAAKHVESFGVGFWIRVRFPAPPP